MLTVSIFMTRGKGKEMQILILLFTHSFQVLRYFKWQGWALSFKGGGRISNIKFLLIHFIFIPTRETNSKRFFKFQFYCSQLLTETFYKKY